MSEDGTLTTYAYSRSGDLLTTTMERGVPDSATPPTVADGTRTITTVNHYGNAIAETTTDILSSLDLDSWVATGVDDRGRMTAAQHTDMTTESWNYDCCHLMSQTDRQGIVTTYSYDALGRQQTTTRLGITDRQILDAEGRVLRRERIGTDASVIVLEETTYDTRVVSTPGINFGDASLGIATKRCWCNRKRQIIWPLCWTISI
jgi:YD repeat-containing protein